MNHFNLTNTTLTKLRAIKMPTIDSGKVVKFFYHYFLNMDEEELSSIQKQKSKSKE